MPALPILPEIGFDTEDIRKAAKKLGNDFYRRLLGMIFQEMTVAGGKILEDAKSATDAFDNPTIGANSDGVKGLLEAGIYADKKPKVTAFGRIVVGFGWTRAYGRVLEFGPGVTEWMIFPKLKKVLRWDTTSFMGPTRSGIAGAKTMFSMSVRHVDKPSHRRPHLVPAAERGLPRLEKRIAKGIEREFLRTRL